MLEPLNPSLDPTALLGVHLFVHDKDGDGWSEPRTCTAESDGMAVPTVTVTGMKGDAVQWLPDGSAGLPLEVNEQIGDLAALAMKREYDKAAAARCLPVPESVVERFRETDAGASVEDIRHAAAVAAALPEELQETTDAAALWIARATHKESVASLTAENDTLAVEVAHLEDTNTELEDGGDSCEWEDKEPHQIHFEGVHQVIQTLRLHGAKALEFRAGNNDVEKILDLLDTAAQPPQLPPSEAP